MKTTDKLWDYYKSLAIKEKVFVTMAFSVDVFCDPGIWHPVQVPLQSVKKKNQLY